MNSADPSPTFKAYLAEQAAVVTNALDKYLPPENMPPKEIHQAIRYSVFAGGKRLRPVLCLAATTAVGGEARRSLPVACALEMIHTYSLIHDDLPAMDDDDLRRGRPTSHIKFGEGMAVLAGDALLTEAFRLLGAEALNSDGVWRERYISALADIAISSSSQGMVAGQVIDILSEGKDLTHEELTGMHNLKTGMLLKASVYCGGVMGGASPEQLGALIDYGFSIGLAFQVIDDILDVVGDSEEMGKSAGADAARGKATYVSILGLEEARAEAEALIAKSLSSLSDFDQNADHLRDLAKYIQKRNK